MEQPRLQTLDGVRYTYLLATDNWQLATTRGLTPCPTPGTVPIDNTPTGARVAGLRGWPVDAADRQT